MQKSNLFDEFITPSASEWKQKIHNELNGADFDERLVWESPEGIKVRPYYHSEDLENIPLHSFGKVDTWKICQPILVDTCENANAKAHDALMKGAESICFEVLSEEIEIKKLVKNIELRSVPVHFDFHFLSRSYLEKNINFIADNRSNINLNLDCIGHLARTGNWYYDQSTDFEILKSIPRGGNVLSVDVSLYQNAGANMMQQLAYAMAHANEYFVQGLVHTTVTFKISVGTNYFFEIAKIRALRLLYKTLAKEYDKPQECYITAGPTKRNKTIYDYNSNMLRTTTESMSAILGGTNTIMSMAYDTVYRNTNEFSECIARNQLLILKEESHFSKVSNPADGSYYIETLTQELAENTLLQFKSIENKGGFLQLLANGSIQQEITASAQVEQEKFDAEEIVLVGSNAYQVPDDSMKSNLEFNVFKEGVSTQTTIEPIAERRLAATLEKARIDNE